MIIPINNLVLVKPSEKEDRTASGLIVPEKAKAEGEILDIGKGEEVSKLGLKIGDTILYRSWGVDVIEEGEKLLLVEYNSIIAKKE